MKFALLFKIGLTMAAVGWAILVVFGLVLNVTAARSYAGCVLFGGFFLVMVAMLADMWAMKP